MKECAMRQMSNRPTGGLSPISLRIADACHITGIGRSKFYELIKAGEIEVIKAGAITLVPKSSIDALLQRSGPDAFKDMPCRLVDVLHPTLANAILTASIAATPEAIRREFLSRTERVRTKAEDGIVEQMISALYKPNDAEI